MSKLELYETPEDELLPPAEDNQHMDASELWIVSYSDFITILMILFLMLFAHRIWAKKVAWEDLRMAQLRAVQESQQGMVQRLSKLVEMDVVSERINIHLPNALLFDAGYSDLRIDAAALLTDLVPDFQKFTGEIIVEGHSDDIPPGPRSKYPSNWELSIARAFSVIKHLTAQGVAPEKMSARGYGEYRPRAPNATAQGRAENRRIEIVLLNPKKMGEGGGVKGENPQ